MAFLYPGAERIATFRTGGTMYVFADTRDGVHVYLKGKRLKNPSQPLLALGRRMFAESDVDAVHRL